MSNKYYYEAQRLSNEILSEKSLPNQNYSQNVVKIMQEKIDFFQIEQWQKFYRV